MQQPLRLTGGIRKVKNVTFILATGYTPGSPFPKFYEKAKANGWKTRTVPCGHDVMVDLPEELTTLLVEARSSSSAVPVSPISTAPRPPIEVRNETVIRASVERVWHLLTDVERWPSWWRVCRWVRLESPTSAEPVVFRWKAHPVELRSAVVKRVEPHCFAITADGRGVHAERSFTLSPIPDGSGTVVVSHETQVGLLPWLGRAFLAPRLHAVNQAMFDDLARAAAHGPDTRR